MLVQLLCATVCVLCVAVLSCAQVLPLQPHPLCSQGLVVKGHLAEEGLHVCSLVLQGQPGLLVVSRALLALPAGKVTCVCVFCVLLASMVSKDTNLLPHAL